MIMSRERDNCVLGSRYICRGYDIINKPECTLHMCKLFQNASDVLFFSCLLVLSEFTF